MAFHVVSYCSALILTASYLWCQGAFAGGGYPEGTPLKVQPHAVVYTRLGALRCKIFSRQCLANQCTLYPTREAAEKSIFFTTKATGVCDEVGWDFISRVMNSRISFTGFCKDMDRFYQTTNIHAAPFISPNTFIQWFFGWLSKFQIDFRKEVDPWCGYNPSVLACDGTHIGVSVRYMNLENFCTKVELPDQIVVPKHKR